MYLSQVYYYFLIILQEREYDMISVFFNVWLGSIWYRSAVSLGKLHTISVMIFIIKKYVYIVYYKCTIHRLPFCIKLLPAKASHNKALFEFSFLLEWAINTVSLMPANDAVLAPSNLAVPLFTLEVLRGCKMSSFHADRLVESWMLLLLSRRKTNLRDIALFKIGRS